MIIRALQAAEALAKSQVANNIKSAEVVPVADDHGLLARPAALAQLGHQQVHIPADNRLLLAHALVGEAVRHGAAEQPVLLASFVDDGGGHGFDGAVEPLCFGELFAAGPVAHDVVPGVWVRDGELVGGDAHDVAVFFVHGEKVEGEGAVDVFVEVGEARDAVEWGAGEAGEGVEVEVVDDLVEDVYYGLGWAVSR